MGTLFKRKQAGGKKGYWYCEYRDHTGKVRRESTKTKDKQSAKEILNHKESQAAKRASGVIDAAAERLTGQGKRPLAEHIGEFEAKMQTAGRSKIHVERVRLHIETIAEFCKFASLGDFTAEGVQAYAADLITTKGRSLRTVQAHLTSVKAFTKWARSTGRIASNPLDAVERPSPDSDRRLERRALTSEEWQRLHAATLAGPERMGMEPGERALLYEVALQSALRSNEVRQLTRGSLHLQAAAPYLTVKAAGTKNKKLARQYIDADLAKRLADHVARKAPAAPVFSLPDGREMADMIREDLAAARRVWIGEAGDNRKERDRRQACDFLAAVNHDDERIDFHALRHTCGAWLAMAGEHPKAIQTIMRHSTIVLTMDTYGHLFPEQTARAITALGKMMAGANPHELAASKAKERATG